MAIKIDVKRESQIRELLHNEGFEFVEHDHAFWRARKAKTNLIFYRSGSFQIQGAVSDSLKERIFAEDQPVDLLAHPIEYPLIGLDESGKGDYFGPLVLAGVLIDREEESILRSAGVADSKRLSALQIANIAEDIGKRVSSQVRVIMPSEYNALYEKHGNLNKLMMEEYIRLIHSLGSNGCRMVILDKFSQSAQQNTVIQNSIAAPIIIEEKAEKYYAVAAASILARDAFNRGMEQLSRQYGIHLFKGSGPEARELYLRLRSDLSAQDFSGVAKTHFKA